MPRLESFGYLIFILAVWLAASLPVYIAAKLVGGKTSIWRAMLASLLGPLTYLIVELILLPSALWFGSIGLAVSALIGLVALLGLYKIIFDTGWAAALAIVVVAGLISLAAAFLLSTLLSLRLTPIHLLHVYTPIPPIDSINF